MKTIIHFLKSQVDTFSEASEKFYVTDRDIENMNGMFRNKSKSFRKTRHLKIKPGVQKGQIWTVKNEYDDFQGITQKTLRPFIVLVKSDSDDIENEDFVSDFRDEIR